MSVKVIDGSTIVKIAAIISLTIICVTALLHGVDSGLASTISAVIGGIAGYEIGRYRREKEEEKGEQQ